jgi:hypothetical protein
MDCEAQLPKMLIVSARYAPSDPEAAGMYPSLFHDATNCWFVRDESRTFGICPAHTVLGIEKDFGFCGAMAMKSGYAVGIFAGTADPAIPSVVLKGPDVSPRASELPDDTPPWARAMFQSINYRFAGIEDQLATLQRTVLQRGDVRDIVRATQRLPKK